MMSGQVKKRDMNIIIGIAIFAAAFYMRLKYRGQGRTEKELFWLSLTAGVISILTIESYATFWQMLWPVIDVTLSTIILCIYHVEIKRQAAVRETRRDQARRAAAHAAAQSSRQARLLSRASVIAMCEYNDAPINESIAA